MRSRLNLGSFNPITGLKLAGFDFWWRRISGPPAAPASSSNCSRCLPAADGTSFAYGSHTEVAPAHSGVWGFRTPAPLPPGIETFCDQEDAAVKAQTIDLITYVEVKATHESDAHALLPALESTQSCGLAPAVVCAWGLGFSSGSSITERCWPGFPMPQINELPVYWWSSMSEL